MSEGEGEGDGEGEGEGEGGGERGRERERDVVGADRAHHTCGGLIEGGDRDDVFAAGGSTERTVRPNKATRPHATDIARSQEHVECRNLTAKHLTGVHENTNTLKTTSSYHKKAVTLGRS